jgi:hypothetical protein
MNSRVHGGVCLFVCVDPFLNSKVVVHGGGGSGEGWMANDAITRRRFVVVVDGKKSKIPSEENNGSHNRCRIVCTSLPAWKVPCGSVCMCDDVMNDGLLLVG